MQSLYIGNDTDAALSATRKLYPDETNFSVNSQGQENLIVIVDEAYSVRFPRSKEIWERGAAEREVLKKLSSTSLHVPKLISISDNPAYVHTTYLKGDHIDATQVRVMSEFIQQQIGKELAQFAFAFHEAVSVDAIQPLLAPPSWSYDDYLKKVLFDRKDPNPKIDALAKKYYRAWLNRKKHKEIIVHDDLHTGNLLFDDNYHIAGILDFGAVCMGSPEQDLRQTYRLGDETFEAAASTYERLSGRPFDRETAKLWTITQELGSYCREDSNEVHKRALDNLRFLFPDIV